MSSSQQQLQVAYIASQELVKYSSLLPSNPARSVLVLSLVNSLGLLSPHYSASRRIQVIKPIRASYKELAAYHSREYLDAVLHTTLPTGDSSPSSVQAVATSAAAFGLEDDCPVFDGMSEYVQLVGGATLTAVKALQAMDIAICWDGGRHHTQKSHASGFSYVADCQLAILSLRKMPAVHDPSRKPKIMYLDLDLHFSDAVSQAFHNPARGSSTSQVLTFSIHHAAPGFFPATPLANLSSPTSPTFDPYTLSIPLHAGASSPTYAAIWPIVERIHNAFEPDYVVLQCGVDGLAGDPCATLNWALAGEPGSLGWCVDRVVNYWGGKKLLLGGGGYNSPNAARAWAYLTSVALNNSLPQDTYIPEHQAFPLYGPSFTLDIPKGNMQDLNSTSYLQEIQVAFDNITTILEVKQHDKNKS